jgi:hypothetical protein
MNDRRDKWDRKDLARRLCHALDIARQAVEQLAANGYTDPVEPRNSIRPEKLISETAVMLLAASAAAYDEEVAERIRSVAHLLIPHARSERMLLGVCLEPALALDFAQAHVCLRRLGYHDPGFDALLRQSAGSQARAGRERAPHRVLEQEWIMETWNNLRSGSQLKTPETALNSVLNQPMDLLSGSRDDIYAFTHALMYVTDFNMCPRRLPRGRTVILAEAEAALARCLDMQDYDLGAEVILALPLTGRSWSAAATFGFRAVARVEDEAGFLPAPSTRLQRLNELRGRDRTQYLLATAYHTAYVMGLLCAVALQRGRSPPSKIPVSTAVRGGANRILHFLEDDNQNAHWWDELRHLNDQERDAIAGLLLTMALCRKTTQREFSAIYQLLEIGYALGLADTPASSQAAEMLERLATFSKHHAAVPRLSSAPRSSQNIDSCNGSLKYSPNKPTGDFASGRAINLFST